MAIWERETQNVCPKGPSFSSSLLDSIYRSIDETRGLAPVPRKPPVHRRNKPEDDGVESLRRAIMIEKWIDNYSATPGSSACRSTPRHLSSNSASSTDSSVFSSSETDSSSASKTTSPKTSLHKLKTARILHLEPPPTARAKTKTRAQKIYGDLKKAKEPISPGGKISNFFTSIFSPRNSKTEQCVDECLRKSRSMKEAATCPLASRSCLSKNASSRGSKSKRTVRFVVDQDCRHNKGIYNDEALDKKVDDLRVFECKNTRKHEARDFYRSDKDLDDVSCASSDLFELENIGRVEIGGYEQELPLYETTSLGISSM